MFKSLSEQIYSWLASQSAFTDLMKREVDGNDKVFVFPIAASIGTSYPFTTYVLSERTPETKDIGQITIYLRFWFDIEKYDMCCEFTDTMTELIDSAFMLESSSVNFSEEYDTYYGEIIFNLI